MNEGYKQVVQQIQALEQHLFEQHPDLLWLSPLIRRQNLDHYKKQTTAAQQGKKIQTQLYLIWQSLLVLLFSRRRKRRSQADFFLLEHGAKRRELLDGVYFNRFPDALTYFLRPHGSVTLGEIIEQPTQWKSERWQAAIHLFIATLHTNILLRVKKLARQSPPQASQLDTVAQIIQENNWHHIHFNPKGLRTDIMRILLFKRFFEHLLKRIKPRQVFSFCYYSKEAFGLTMAAKALNIPVIEVQHGSQGAAHPMYAAYHGAAAQRYELLPDILWVWSTAEEEYIRQWADNSGGPMIIRGGNPWLAYYKTRITPKKQGDISRPKRVLISLQEPHYFHESFLPEMLQQSPPGIEWWLRVHPLYAELKEELKTIFTDHPNIIIAGIAQQNLYEQFAEVDFNITAFSTTCLEGLEFGVPSIIIHPNGMAYFSHHLQQGYFRYADNATSCLEIIQKNDFVRPSTTFLQGDEETIRLAINKLETITKAKQSQD